MEISNSDYETRKEDLFLSFFDIWNDYKFDRNYTALKECLINQAVLNAYDDATRQGAYNTKIGKEEELLQARSAEAQGECVKYLLGDKENKGAVEELLKAKDGYNTKHREVCNHLCEEYMKEDENGINLPFFTFGNAQKWVNMTMKYLYVYASFLDEMVDIRDNNPLQCILNLKSELHIPLDRYILKAVFFKETRDKIGDDKLINKSVTAGFNCVNKDGALCFSTDNAGEVTCNSVLCEVNNNNNRITKPKNSAYVSWSNIPYYENYMEVQHKIKECIQGSDRYKNLPMEWENKVWSTVVRIENN